MIAGPAGLAPVTDDPDTAGFFEAAAQDRLVVQVCGTCDEIIHLPTGFCARCAKRTDSWKEVSGPGVLHSWIVVEHQVHRAFPVPYTTVLVELVQTPGIRFLGWCDGRPDLWIGMPMALEFVDAGGVRVPNWVPADKNTIKQGA